MRSIYTRCQKLSTTYILLKLISINREEILSSTENLYLLWNSALILKWKFKVHVISGFGYKVMSFCNLSKLLAMARKSSRSNPQHLETNFVSFSHKIFNIYSHTQSCKENKLTWPLCAFCWTHHHILWQNSMIVSLSYPYIMMQL